MREGGKSFAIKNINISNHGSTINRVIFCTFWGRRMKEIEKQNKFTECQVYSVWTNLWQIIYTLQEKSVRRPWWQLDKVDSKAIV